VPSLESRIDDLYKLQPGEFVAARNALAKTLPPDDARRVKSLAKPTVVPWAANQLFWHDRSTFDRLAKAGEKLRAAQIGALKGRASDLQSAAAAHRKALGEAIAAATRLAQLAGQSPPADTLGRMLEAVSLSDEPAEPPGRFTTVLQLAGFEALAGIPIKGGGAPQRAHLTVVGPGRGSSAKERAAAEDEEAAAERERAAQAERERRAAITQAETAVAQARLDEARARKAWENSKERLDEAARELDRLRGNGTPERPSKK
jgi:hypothetical protein